MFGFGLTPSLRCVILDFLYLQEGVNGVTMTADARVDRAVDFGFAVAHQNVSSVLFGL